MSGTSEDVEMLLAGLEVESVRELRRLVLQGRAHDHWIRQTARNHDTPHIPVPGKPGWRRGNSGIEWYSSAWLDDPNPVSSETSRGAAERQPHGCEGQLQQ